NQVMNHPHWNTVLFKTFEVLYPIVSLNPEEAINQPFVPANISYDLMLMDLLDQSAPQKILDRIKDPTILYQYTGDQPTTTSTYLSALQFNIFRLIAQREEEILNSPPPHGLPNRTTPAEVAIYYVSTNLGVPKAIEYL